MKILGDNFSIYFLFLLAAVSAGGAIFNYFTYRNFEYTLASQKSPNGAVDQINLDATQQGEIAITAYFLSETPKYELVRPSTNREGFRIILHNLMQEDPSPTYYKLSGTLKEVPSGRHIVEIYDRAQKKVILSKEVETL